MKPFAESSEQNKHAILSVLQEEFCSVKTVLEIASGTGQHAVYFAAQLPHLTWSTSELPELHAGIRAWLTEANNPRINGPHPINVNQSDWPIEQVDAVFSANSAHIMSWPSVINMFRGIGRILSPSGIFCLYGPFLYADRHTADSNQRFDVWLKQRDPESGIRDVEALKKLGLTNNLVLLRDHEMPVNNRLLVWQKSAPDK